MSVYKLTAPRQMGKIPEGWMIQVASPTTSSEPNAEDVEKAIIHAGFSDSESRSYRSAGNWKVEKLA